MMRNPRLRAPTRDSNQPTPFAAPNSSACADVVCCLSICPRELLLKLELSTNSLPSWSHKKVFESLVSRLFSSSYPRSSLGRRILNSLSIASPASTNHYHFQSGPRRFPFPWIAATFVQGLAYYLASRSKQEPIAPPDPGSVEPVFPLSGFPQSESNEPSAARPPPSSKPRCRLPLVGNAPGSHPLGLPSARR